MRINSITYTPDAVNFAAKKKKRRKEHSHYVSPFRAAVTTTAIWFGFGVVSQEMSNRLGKILKSDKKSALFLNSGFALTFGIIDGIKAHIRNKKAAK